MVTGVGVGVVVAAVSGGRNLRTLSFSSTRLLFTLWLTDLPSVVTAGDTSEEVPIHWDMTLL